jgi:hypothetical protein
MQRVNKMKEMMKAMTAISSQSQTTKVELFIGKQEDYPKWVFEQKQNFVVADGGSGTCSGHRC